MVCENDQFYRRRKQRPCSRALKICLEREAHADQTASDPAGTENKTDGRQTPQNGPRKPQQALIQRFSASRQGTERHGKGGPISMFPVHGKRDAIGEYRGERGLDCRLARSDNTLWSGMCANELGASAQFPDPALLG